MKGNQVESKAGDNEDSDDTTKPEADTIDNGILTDDKNADDPSSVDAGGEVIPVMTVILLTQGLAPLMSRQKLMPLIRCSVR